MSGDGNDEAQWYYANGEGNLYKSEIKKINGKYYAFDEYGAMLSGLVYMNVTDGTIDNIVAKENAIRDNDTVLDADYLDDLKSGVKGVTGATLYYFGDPDNADGDGAMKTGNVNVSIDGSNYTFNFATAGGVEGRGAGKTGVTKSVYYKNGMKMSASTEDKYRAASISNSDVVTFAIKDDMKGAAVDKDYKTVVYKQGSNSQTKIKYLDLTNANYYLNGTNGKTKKNASGVKDGEEWYFFSDEFGKVLYYGSDKNLLKALGIK